VNEGSLGVHKIELMVESREDFGDGCRVRDHTDSSHNLSEITSRDNGGGLVVDSNLESGGTPVNELNGSLSLDGSNGSVDILGDNISSVHHRASHIFSVTGITLSHHGGGFE